MTTFCRITGCARNLPKPCYFPLLPPITPAEAKKLCKITGKASDIHSYSPIISFGKPIRFDGTEGCKITKHESLIYLRPVFERTKENEKNYFQLEDVLKKMKIKLKKRPDNDHEFVYHMSEQKTNLVVPPEMEEAIRLGELETLSMSKDSKYVNVKIRMGRIIKMDLRTLAFSEIVDRENLFYGRGQNKDVLEEQQKILDERNKRKANTLARKQRFEALDAKAEAEELRDTVKPAYNKPRVKFNAKQRAEKLAKMEAMLKEQADNKAILLPKVDVKKLQDEQLQYERMLADIMKAQVSSVKIIAVASGLDWHAVNEAESVGFDWESFPHEEWIDPVEFQETVVAQEEVVTRDDVTNLEIVVSVETVRPALPMPQEVARVVYHMEVEALKKTEHVAETLKSTKDVEMIPAFTEINKIAMGIENAELGYLVKKEDGVEFVAKSEYVPGEIQAVSGALVEVDEKKKFVAGQIIKLADQESFVAGQTVETPLGKKFVPGQTVMNSKGDINFVPGQCVKSLDEKINFVAGQIFNSPNGPKFVAGQVMDRGNGESVFVAGQTIDTDDGPKFSPGEVTVDAYGENLFVPGMKIPTEGGDKFVTGQAFQSEEGLTFKPGQIMDTIEGPTFVPGKTFDTPEGKKFIKGDLVEDEEGTLKFEHRPFEVSKISEWLVIPNKELQPLAVADRNVAGFIVNPTNTDTVQAGEKLYGDMVETQEAVQFYITGRLPKDVSPESKVIPGQLIVNECDKRFVPGKLMNTMDEEKFVPGQTVNTSHGEEFIPGQIVESTDGPKFVPGQVVMTARGEKFVPGQVIVEDEGPKFVPGQIIQTKNGATFIPGQMMSTDEGQLFVPGQLVETNAGPRFVPGQVVESPEGPKFIPGTIIETDEGLKYVPPDADEIDEDFQISFQGFEISEEELALLMTNPTDTRPHSPIFSEDGLIDSATLQKLAVNTVVVHGVTPEPPPPEKKKKKKKAKVQLDAAEEDEKLEVEEPDEGTDKVDVLLKFIKASTCYSESRRAKEMKKLSRMLGEREHDNLTALQVDAMTHILATVNGSGEVVRMFLGEDEHLISDIVDYIDSTDTDAISRNDQARRTLRKAIQRVVSKRCDREIDDIIHLLNIDPENLLTDTRTQILLTEAVGIVCVTGNVEVAAMLEKFISEPSDPNALRDNQDVVSVLRQLIVLHQIAERDPEVAKMLQVLQNNPEGLKDRKKIREQLKTANLLLKLPKEPKENVDKFNLRHVASSKDIPTKIFEQIREDRKEADKFIDMLPDELFREIMQDKRCGESFLETLDSEKAGRAKSELHKFKKGMAIVVTKADMQAVIPREFARSICYGIVPYLLIDEEGFKFFERGLTGRKLAPARVIENTWYMPDSYYAKKPLFERSMSGEQYSMVLLGKRRASAAHELLYTSLLPSSGPTKLSYPKGTNGNLDDLLPYRRSSKASSIIWSDLDGAPLTMHRKGLNGLAEYNPTTSRGSQGINGFGDYSVTSRRGSQSINGFGDYSSSTRRGSQAHSDLDDMERSSRGVTELSGLDSGNSLYRRGAQEEQEESTYNAVVPYNPVAREEEFEPAPLCRSDTVAKLMDKYTNFSTKREFGYHAPDSAWSRHLGETREFVSRLPDVADEEVEEPIDGAGYTPSERKLLPSTKPSPRKPGKDISGLRESREHSPMPLSSSSNDMSAANLHESYALVPVDDDITDRRRETSSYRDPEARETSGVSQARSSRRYNKYQQDEESSTPPSKRKSKRQDAKYPMLENLEATLPMGRPGGALQRYRDRKVKEARDLQDYNEALNDIGDWPEPPKDPRGRASKSSKGRSLQQDDDLYSSGGGRPSTQSGRSRPDEDGDPKASRGEDTRSRPSQDPYGQGVQDSYSRIPEDSYGRASQDPYGRASQDPYGRASQDPYGRASQDPYGRASQDPYGRASQDPYGRASQDPYGRDSQDLYGRGFQDSSSRASQSGYGRDQEYGHGERSMKGRYAGEEASISGYNPRQPAYGGGLTAGYGQDYGGYDTGGGGYGSRYGGGYGVTGGYGAGGYGVGGYGAGGYGAGGYGAGGGAGGYNTIGGYGGGYGMTGGVGGYGGGASGGNAMYSRGYGANNMPTGLDTQGLAPVSAFTPAGARLNHGRSTRSPLAQKFLPNIDEEDTHSGRSFTPREEERQRISSLAQKYLKKSYLDDE
ncbi:uncharacterized protein LOC121874418 [Homarus americanus]|uniref:uncharacterized protein LOC121874418 n=1 Tax=Homarus americanus TaxID=6706 RepID=UPI001C46F2EB|nr:uncharacterized protein LOC121874418 [Homarus americanus]